MNKLMMTILAVVLATAFSAEANIEFIAQTDLQKGQNPDFNLGSGTTLSLPLDLVNDGYWVHIWYPFAPIGVLAKD